MIALYAFIVFSFLITIIDMIIRFPLQSQAVGYSDIQLIVINILGIIIQIVFFTYGLYQAVKGTLSPKRMGVVIVAYFGAMCITGSENIIRYATWQLVCVGIAFNNSKHHRCYCILFAILYVVRMIRYGRV